MSISLNNEADVLLWSFEMLIETCQAKQYVFAAQCVWWISAIIGLQPAQVYFTGIQWFPSELQSRVIQPPRSHKRIKSNAFGIAKEAGNSEELGINRVLDWAELFWK